ncbi:hypothetical protein SK128_009919 [Halocaridina rubra]|uniref:Uncharacterized protein n=1 Tax=Halocaridina rubra TaxID=373956 RepID=A0AAN8WQJ9_HALRR
MNLALLFLATLGGLGRSFSLPDESLDKNYSPNEQGPAMKPHNVKPSLFQEVFKASKDMETYKDKGFEYYLVNYGPLAKILIIDFMQSFGLARNLQLAIPVIAKMVLIVVIVGGMQFQPSLLEFQQTARSAYLFLQNFNEPEVRVMNDITDRVFEVLDNEIARRR